MCETQWWLFVNSLMQLPCIHTIFLTNNWKLTKVEQIHHLDRKRLDFGDLDLICKVTLALWNSKF